MEYLNYHHLRYFWTVAREGGFTKAAAKLHVSKPTISAQIQAQEGVLGEKQFRRVGRNLALTDAGQHVLGFAEEIFSLGQDLMNSVKQRPTARPVPVSGRGRRAVEFKGDQAARVDCREGAARDADGAGQ